MKKNSVLNQFVTASMFAALIFLLTYFVKLPAGRGYIHIGDTMIYLAACFLPTPFAMLSAGIGGALADIFGGYIQYILPTFIIKMLIALLFSYNEDSKILTKRNTIMIFPAAVITIVGYYFTSVVLLAAEKMTAPGGFAGGLLHPATWIGSLTTIPDNIIQSVASGLVFLFAAAALDKSGFKRRMNKFIFLTTNK